MGSMHTPCAAQGDLRRYRSVVLAAAGLTTLLIASAWGDGGQQKKPRTSAITATAGAPGLTLFPESTVLSGSYGFQTLSVITTAGDGGSLEVTSQATFTSSNPAVVAIKGGIAIPTG